MKAMILAAGLGTRLKPWTDEHPKALVPVNGKPLLRRNIEYLNQYGYDEIIINVHHFADQITSYLQQNDFNCSLTLSYEQEEALETGGGLRKAAWFFEGETGFLLMNTDILTTLDLNAFAKAHHENASMVTLAVTTRKASRSFLFDEDNWLRGWRNNQTGEEKIVEGSTIAKAMAFSGIHYISTSFLEQMWEEGKFSLVEVYLRLAHTGIIKGFDHSGDLVIDVGKPEAIAQAEKLFA